MSRDGGVIAEEFEQHVTDISPPVPPVPYDFNCPTCGAPAGQLCVTKSGATTEPHTVRGPAKP